MELTAQHPVLYLAILHHPSRLPTLSTLCCSPPPQGGNESHWRQVRVGVSPGEAQRWMGWFGRMTVTGVPLTLATCQPPQHAAALITAVLCWESPWESGQGTASRIVSAPCSWGFRWLKAGLAGGAHGLSGDGAVPGSSTGLSGSTCAWSLHVTCRDFSPGSSGIRRGVSEGPKQKVSGLC